MPTEGGNFPQLTANKETGTSVVQLQGTEFCHQPPRQACVWEGGEARAGCCEAPEGMSESGGGGWQRSCSGGGRVVQLAGSLCCHGLCHEGVWEVGTFKFKPGMRVFLRLYLSMWQNRTYFH